MTIEAIRTPSRAQKPDSAVWVPVATGLWVGNTSQSGGSLQVNSTTTELGAVFDLGIMANPNGIDMRGMQMIQVVAKKVAGANPDLLGIVAAAFHDPHDEGLHQQGQIHAAILSMQA